MAAAAERQQQPGRRQLALRIEGREDDEPAGIVGDGEEQQEHHRRMPGAEHHPPDEIGEGDVGGGRDRPAVCQRREAAERRGAAKVDRGRPHHATGGRDQRCDRPAPAQRAVLECHGLPDLLAGDREEQRHQHVVDQVVQGQRAVRVPLRVDMQVTDPATLE